MNRNHVRTILRSAAVVALAGTLVCGGLAAYCAWEVDNFYDGAHRLHGTIVEVNRLAGGNAPVVRFADEAGGIQVKQFGPFYEETPQAIGQIRTVLYNPEHELQSVIDSPWNWIGSIVYGSAAAVLFAIAGILLFIASRALPPRLAPTHGA